MDEKQLLERAAQGDRAAAGTYLGTHLPALRAAARHIAAGRVDPDDLLADAVEGLLGRWADGQAHIASPRSYLLVSMRNRVLNEARSPRSRTSQLDPALDIVDRSAGAVDDALELEHELAWLRVALDKLPSAQREALLEAPAPTGTTAVQATRSAEATHSLRGRARRSLRRAYLQVVLEEGAPPSCHEAIAKLPAQVGDSPEATPAAPEHMRSCPRCRKRWAVFAGLAGSLGIAGIAVAQPAQSEFSKVSGEDQPASAASVSAGRRLPARSMILTGTAIATAGVALVALALTGPSLGFAGASSASASGLPFGTALRVPLQSVQPGGPGTVTASMHYSASGYGNATDSAKAQSAAERVEVRLEFEVSAEPWHTKSLEWKLPGSLAIVSAPNGWSCDGGVCNTNTASARGGTFVLHGSAMGSEDRIEVSWIAEAAGSTVSARALSAAPAVGEIFATSATDERSR